MKLLKSIWCLLVGHKAWAFNPKQQAFLVYRDGARPDFQLTVHICRRCGSFHADSKVNSADGLIRITDNLMKMSLEDVTKEEELKKTNQTLSK